VLREDRPLVTLRLSALAQNIEQMQLYSQDHSALLAPQRKTTMAPELFKMQLD